MTEENEKFLVAFLAWLYSSECASVEKRFGRWYVRAAARAEIYEGSSLIEAALQAMRATNAWGGAG